MGDVHVDGEGGAERHAEEHGVEALDEEPEEEEPQGDECEGVLLLEVQLPGSGEEENQGDAEGGEETLVLFYELEIQDVGNPEIILLLSWRKSAGRR